MKLYLAGPWLDRAVMPAMAKRVEDAGHTVTHKWWDVEGDILKLKTENPDFDETAYMTEHAVLDRDAVHEADLLIVLNSQKSEGKATEQGMAIALDKPIIIIGTKGLASGNIFHYLKNYRWAADEDAAMDILATIAWLFAGVK